MNTETRLKKHLRYNGKIHQRPCVFCGMLLDSESEEEKVHYLFTEGFLMPACNTKRYNIINNNMIEKYALRDVGRSLKRQYKRSLRNKKVVLWRYYIRQFFESQESNKCYIKTVRKYNRTNKDKHFYNEYLYINKELIKNNIRIDYNIG